jgi:hypothetical protein
MPVTGSVTAYADRQIDMLAFHGAGIGISELVEMVLVGENDSGFVIAGIAKLAQRFLIELLTEQGSIPYDPVRGSTFMIDLRLGRVRTTLAAETSFYLALAQTKLQLQLEETEDMPDDERYGRTNLDSIILDPADTLKLRLTLFSLAGTGVTLLLPIETTLG